MKNSFLNLWKIIKQHKLKNIIIVFVLITLIGVGYAFFLEQKNTEFGTLISGNLEMDYLTGEELLLTRATPIYDSDVAEKASYMIFSIENKGTVNMYTDISLENIVIDDILKTDNFKWRIEQGQNSTEEGFYDSFIIESGTFENFSTNSKTLVTNRYIKPGETKYYKVSVWLSETGEIQNDIMGAKFKAKIKAVGYAKSKSRNFAGLNPALYHTTAGRTISNFKLYGNSVQNGTPTASAPVEIQSVGDIRPNLVNYEEIIENSGGTITKTTYNGRECLTWQNGAAAENLKILQGKFKENTIYYLSGDILGSGSISVVYTDGTKERIYFNIFLKNATEFSELSLSIGRKSKTIDYIQGHYESAQRIYVDINTFQVVEGKYYIPYREYNDSNSSKYIVPVKVDGQNLFNINGDINKDAGNAIANQMQSNYVTADGHINIRGSVTSNVPYGQWIDVEKGQTYTFGATLVSTGTGSNVPQITIISGVDASTISTLKMPENGTTYSTTFVATTDRVLLSFRKTGVGYGNSGCEVKDVFLINGKYTEDKLPTYQQYIKPTIYNIYLDEPLRSVGNVKDYIDFENKQVVRNIGVIDNTGTQTIENSYQVLETPVTEKISLPNIKTLGNTTMLSVNNTVKGTFSGTH